MTDKNAPPPIVEPQSLAPHCTADIVEEGMEDRREAVGNAGLDDDDAQFLCTVLEGLETRSRGVREALEKALANGGGGSMPLLGLETTPTENTGLNPCQIEDSDETTMLAPLLGTNTSESTGILGKSSKRWSPESVCYDELLRESPPSSGNKSQKTVRVLGGDCYGKPLCAPHQPR